MVDVAQSEVLPVTPTDTADDGSSAIPQKLRVVMTGAFVALQTASAELTRCNATQAVEQVEVLVDNAYECGIDWSGMSDGQAGSIEHLSASADKAASTCTSAQALQCIGGCVNLAAACFLLKVAHDRAKSIEELKKVVTGLEKDWTPLKARLEETLQTAEKRMVAMKEIVDLEVIKPQAAAYLQHLMLKQYTEAFDISQEVGEFLGRIEAAKRDCQSEKEQSTHNVCSGSLLAITSIPMIAICAATPGGAGLAAANVALYSASCAVASGSVVWSFINIAECDAIFKRLGQLETEAQSMKDSIMTLRQRIQALQNRHLQDHVEADCQVSIDRSLI